MTETALTAHVLTEDRLRVLRVGHRMHVTKPVEVAELRAGVTWPNSEL